MNVASARPHCRLSRPFTDHRTSVVNHFQTRRDIRNWGGSNRDAVRFQTFMVPLSWLQITHQRFLAARAIRIPCCCTCVQPVSSSAAVRLIFGKRER